jgi:hypothetical protein
MVAIDETARPTSSARSTSVAMKPILKALDFTVSPTFAVDFDLTYTRLR